MYWHNKVTEHAFIQFIRNISLILIKVLILSFLEAHLCNAWVGSIVLPTLSNPLKDFYYSSYFYLTLFLTFRIHSHNWHYSCELHGIRCLTPTPKREGTTFQGRNIIHNSYSSGSTNIKPTGARTYGTWR